MNIDGKKRNCSSPPPKMASPSQRIHLDHNAGSPLRPQVRKVIEEFASNSPLNPSSIHTDGRKARKVLEESRERVAHFIGASPGEIVFTSGGTECAHLAWKHFSRSGVRAVTAAVEHHCVLDAALQAEKNGAVLYQIYCTSTGGLQEANVEEAFAKHTDFFSLHHANNETGVIYPVADLARRAKNVGAVVHTDAVQSAGKVPVNVQDLGVDYLSLSGHKLGAPTGVGALYVRKGSPFESIWLGGSQERGRRTGTENLLGIISMGAACAAILEEDPAENQRIVELRDYLEEKLKESISGMEITGQRENRLPNTSHITFDGVDGESLLIAADLAGINCSAGAACASGSLKPSHVLTAMGMPAERARGSLRLSLGWSTTAEEIDTVTKTLPKLVFQVRDAAKQFA